MVAWFAPAQLLRTAFRTFFATVIAGFVDRRETQGRLPPCPGPGGDRRPPHSSAFQERIEADFREREGKQEVWIDYVADLGDGWDPAYAVSYLLSRRKLRVAGLSDPSLPGAPLADESLVLGGDELPRADLLVLGGDQVYPTPSREAYTDRLVAPLACAFPPLDEPRSGIRPPPDAEVPAPLLFAVPGNHDWYDGLTDFIRVFCQCAPIGRWRTRQRRSYFSVRLPHRWWLWGIDIQLDTRIDPVQLDHFRSLARTSDGGGDEPKRVILCTAQPGWIQGRTGLEASYKNLLYFERQVLAEPPDAGSGSPTIPVTIAGDLHHYSRYLEYSRNGGDADREPEPRHRITCGPGGAYVRGTHSLPRRIARPKRPSQRDRGRGRRAASEGELIEAGFPYPGRDDSRRLALGALRLPLLPHNGSFCLLVGALYALLAATLGVGSRAGEIVSSGAVGRSPSGYVEWAQTALLHLPTAMAAAALLLLLGVGLAVAFNRAAPRRLLVAAWGALHGAAHVATALLLAWAAAGVAGIWLRPATPPFAVAVCAGVLLGGAVLGGFLVGAYLVASSLLWHLHDNEVFSVQSIPDFRSFLRLRIDAAGNLTIYPLGVRRVPRSWRRRFQRQSGDPHFDPADDVVPRVHLIDGPIHLPAR